MSGLIPGAAEPSGAAPTLPCRSSPAQPVRFFFYLFISFFSLRFLLSADSASRFSHLSPIPWGRTGLLVCGPHLDQQRVIPGSPARAPGTDNSNSGTKGSANHTGGEFWLGDAGRAAQEVPVCCLGRERGKNLFKNLFILPNKRRVINNSATFLSC